MDDLDRSLLELRMALARPFFSRRELRDLRKAMAGLDSDSAYRVLRDKLALSHKVSRAVPMDVVRRMTDEGIVVHSGACHEATATHGTISRVSCAQRRAMAIGRVRGVTWAVFIAMEVVVVGAVLVVLMW